jgi:hypothetical protein
MEQTEPGTIYMPEPTEDSVMAFEPRTVALPNGVVLNLRLCRWHWQMIAFFDLWNDYYAREDGIVYEWFKATVATPSLGSFEREFSDTIMIHLRDIYEEAHRDLAPGERKPFEPPPSYKTAT